MTINERSISYVKAILSFKPIYLCGKESQLLNVFGLMDSRHGKCGDLGYITCLMGSSPLPPPLQPPQLAIQISFTFKLMIKGGLHLGYEKGVSRTRCCSLILPDLTYVL